MISGAQMAKGFRRVLDAAADLRLDVPEAPQQIAAFIARAIVDNVLPPAFVDDIPTGAPSRLRLTALHVRQARQ